MAAHFETDRDHERTCRRVEETLAELNKIFKRQQRQSEIR